jgi:hypothetical protein
MTGENKKILPRNFSLVAAMLKEGKENAITTKEIIKRLGWKGNDQRNVFHIINRLIEEHGYLIGSSRKGESRGYYLISNIAELDETVKVAEKQANSELRKIRKLRENYLNQSVTA